MKKLLLNLIFILLAAVAVKAQYIVTKVNGRVKKADGSYVAPGMQLTDNDKLTWGTTKDNIWVVVIGKGEKVLSPAPAASGSGVITQYLLAAVRQSSNAASLSGRGDILEKIPDALNTNPQSNHKVIIEQENKFVFDPKVYPQTDRNTFFVEIDMPGVNPVIRRLKTKGDTLLISYSDLLTETTGPSVKYTLGYHNPTAASPSVNVANFTPYFDLTNETDDFIASTLLAYKGTTMSQTAVRDSVYQNLYAGTGKPNGLLFMTLFNKYWQGNGPVAPPTIETPTGAGFSEANFLKVPKLSGSVSATRDELPANFSLRQYAPPVGYQAQFGSCVAWSTAYAARTIAYAVKNNYTINNNYDKIIASTFAPDFIYNNIRLTGDCLAPTYLDDALKFMKQKGNIVKVGDVFNCGIKYDATVLTGAQNYKIKDFVRVNDSHMNSKELIQKMKSLLVAKHALPFGMYFSESIRAIGPSGIWNPTDANRVSVQRARAGQEPYNGHAMCIIGYNDAINNGSFEVMNSWGAWTGNKGFYWINYDDLCAFVADIYAINDFETTPDTPAPAVVKAADPVKPAPVAVIKPIAIVPKEMPQVVIVKPSLKGDMEFMLMKADDSFETVPVTKGMVTTRGQVLESDKEKDPSAYANFVLSKPFYSGNKYKIKFNLAQPAYVYVIGMDKESNYNLFPQQKYNESALINIKNTTLFLPNDSTHYTLDNVTGKEKMCVLVSKSAIDIEALNQKFIAAGDHNLYQAVRSFLPQRLLEVKEGNYLDNKVSFNTEVNEDNVLAFFIEINHL